MANFFQTFTDRFTCDLAIDLGSTNTVIFRRGSGIIVNEPSLVAFQRCPAGLQPLQTGAGAKEMLRAGQEDVLVVKPVQFGAIADFAAGKQMLTSYFERIKRVWCAMPVRVIATVPARATENEKSIFRELILAAGAREVYLMEEPRALAAGAGLDLADEKDNMIVDIGGAITEIATITEGRVTHAAAVPVAGDHLDQAIVDFISDRRGVSISLHEAEQLKIRLADAYPAAKEKITAVTGYRTGDQTPASVTVTTHEIREALSETIKTISSAIKAFLESLPAGQSVDILDRGIVFGGGSSLLNNFDRLLEREIQYPFRKVRDPLTCLVRGTGEALNYLAQFREAQ